MKTPLLPLLLPFMTGILIADSLMGNWGGLMAALGALTTGLLLIVQWRLDRASTPHPRRQTLSWTCIFFTFFALGFALTQMHRPSPIPKEILSEPNVLIEAEVKEMPKVGERKVRFAAEVQHIKTSDTVFSQPRKVQFFVEKDSLSCSLSQGDRLLIYSRLLQPNRATNPHQFDYQQYLYHKGIVAQCFVASYQYRVVGHRNSLLAQVASLRNRTLEMLRQSSLTPSQQGIAEALLLGWKNDVDPSTTMQFRNAGITHLLCVSGLHVGIVAALLGACLFWIRGRRYSLLIKGILQLTGIWFFVILTGMAPSTVRAAIMFSFIIIGHLLHLRPSTLNSVAASALLLLIVNPFLLFDVGFQLSYAAVGGIILLTPLMNGIFPWDRWKYPRSYSFDIANKDYPVRRAMIRIVEKGWNLISVTTAAQLATLPLVLFYFHQFPLYFLIANITIIPLAGFLMGTLLLMVGFRWWHWLSALCTHLFSIEIQGIDALTKWISNLPHSLLAPIYFDWVMAILLGLWLCLSGWISSRKRPSLPLLSSPSHSTPRWTRWGLLVLPVFLTARIVAVNHQHLHQKEWIIYSSTKTTAIEFFNQKESTLLLLDSTKTASDISFERDENATHHGTRKSLIISGMPPTEKLSVDLSLKSPIVGWESLRILCVDRNNFRSLPAQPESGRADYLLLSQSPYIGVDQLRHQCEFDTLLIAAQNSPRYRQAWIRECDQLGVPYIDLSKGALVRRRSNLEKIAKAEK